MRLLVKREFFAVKIFITLFIILTSAFWETSHAAQMNPKEVYRTTSKAVVLIFNRNDGKRDGSKGTGTIIKPGYVLTNAHVVLDKSGKPYDRTTVYMRPKKIDLNAGKNLKNGRRAEVVEYNTDYDLALLSVKGLPSVAPIPLGDSSKVEIGDDVLAIGHPENGGLWSLTSGRIGAILRNFNRVQGKHVFQTEASLNRGNSGGPLIDYNGQLIGVNTSIARRSKDGLAIVGINFSVQSAVAKRWLESVGFPIEIKLVPVEPLKIKPTAPEQPPAGKTDPRDKKTAKAAPDLGKKEPFVQKNESENKILTPKRPYKEKDIFDLLMEAKETEIDQQMDEMFNKF